mmetsp:Transcript_134182/g.286970  ORF Transcript_134182/g.286970 Transcript_134182/m.286970 type:complete len:211 (+) Transcript_134182:1822-2454(+)
MHVAHPGLHGDAVPYVLFAHHTIFRPNAQDDNTKQGQEHDSTSGGIEAELFLLILGLRLFLLKCHFRFKVRKHGLARVQCPVQLPPLHGIFLLYLFVGYCQLPSDLRGRSEAGPILFRARAHTLAGARTGGIFSISLCWRSRLTGGSFNISLGWRIRLLYIHNWWRGRWGCHVVVGHKPWKPCVGFNLSHGYLRGHTSTRHACAGRAPSP